MSKGFTLIEILVVLCIAAGLLAFWVPRATRLMDWIETERAVRDVTTALAVGRNGAIMQSTRARITFRADSIRIDRLRGTGWEPWWRIAGTGQPWGHARSVESDRAVRTHRHGMGRVKHEDRAAPGVSSRNDYDVPRRTCEALVDATVQRVAASNRMKLGCGAVRSSKGRG